MENIHKTRAFLTEFIIVIFFFAISMVITVHLFVSATEKSENAVNLTNSTIAMDNVAAKIKLNGDKIDNPEDLDFTQYFDKNWCETDRANAKYVLYVTTVINRTSTGKMCKAEIEVYEGESLINSKMVIKYYQE